MTQIVTDNEILYRQVHPDFYVDGVLLSPAFKPTPNDMGKMSVDRSSLIDAESAYAYFTQEQKRHSACVCGITVAEFAADAIACYSDPLEAVGDVAPNSAHCLADFTSHEEKKWKNIAKKLKNHALRRGICFTPEIGAPSI